MHKIINEFIKKIELPSQSELIKEIRFLWLHDYREMQYVAMSILAKFQQKKFFDNLGFIEFMIINKSWWDTVDFIVANIVFNYFNTFPEQIQSTTDKWIENGNLWQQRSSIIFQLKAKTNTNLNLLFSIIERLKHIDDFFIQKAIGWSLRQYSKTNPQIIIDYVHKNNFSNFAKREALKYIRKK